MIPEPERVSAALAELATLDREALVERWVAVFGCPAPRNSQMPFLRNALAWQLQMQANPQWRGSSGASRLTRSLRQSPASCGLAPGTRLLRQWQDRTHQVTVLDHGFDYDGSTYRSLSAIARRITGTAWSGPRFFGILP